MTASTTPSATQAVKVLYREGKAGLIVVYATNMADQIAANIKAANHLLAMETDIAADELAAEIKAAEAATA